MQGQQAGRRIERSAGGAVDIAFVQLHPRGQGTEGLLGQRQHLRRGIDPAEAPARVCGGKGFQLQPAAGPQDEDMRILGRAFGQEDAGHLLQRQEAGHLPHRPLGIPRHHLGIGK